MSKSILSAPHFTDEAAAYAFVEAHIWPDGPICPHCGGVDKIGKLAGKSTRIGVYKCYQCRKPFSVKIGTIFEDSHVALHVWLQAIHLMCSSKKGISANQLHRVLGVSLKTGWFMGHRIREAMKLPAESGPIGGDGKTVEVDETFYGRLDGVPKQRSGTAHKNVVLTLVERGGSARSFHVDSTSIADLIPIVKANIKRETEVMTDELPSYRGLRSDFAGHSSVNHGREEYARYEGGRVISTNTVEGYYSVFKRGMKGTYQHCGERHLHRYLAEFDFRYSNRVALGVNDTERAELALRGVVGRRLTYRQ